MTTDVLVTAHKPRLTKNCVGTVSALEADAQLEQRLALLRPVGRTCGIMERDLSVGSIHYSAVPKLAVAPLERVRFDAAQQAGQASLATGGVETTPIVPPKAKG